MGADAALLEGVRGLYVRLDAAVEKLGLACRGCGRCCRGLRRSPGERPRSGDAELDHVLFVSGVEALYLCRNGLPSEGGDSVCPFFKGGRCAAHPLRAIGCRTFFCDQRRRDELQDLYEAALREAKDLARRFGLEWRYAPLSEQLERVRSEVTTGG